MTGFSYILLGSNMGSRDSIINKAVSMINDRCGLVISKSSFYESEPWGFESENAFLNQVIIIKTEKNAHELLKILLSIEIELGRDRKHHYDTYVSRPIDIDILYYDDLICDSEDLQLPHPRLHLRRFTLMPLCEIAPDFVHPIFSKTNEELLECCVDDLSVKLYSGSMQ